MRRIGVTNVLPSMNKQFRLGHAGGIRPPMKQYHQGVDDQDGRATSRSQAMLLFTQPPAPRSREKAKPSTKTAASRAG